MPPLTVTLPTDPARASLRDAIRAVLAAGTPPQEAARRRVPWFRTDTGG